MRQPPRLGIHALNSLNSSHSVGMGAQKETPGIDLVEDQQLSVQLSIY
jgi:hypothetical protein